MIKSNWIFILIYNVIVTRQLFLEGVIMKTLQTICLAILLILFIMNCGDKESKAFIEKKLELRQRIDEKILMIDEKLEDFREELENTTDEIKSREISEDITQLEKFRKNLRDKTENMKNISDYEWEDFKERVENKFNEIEGAITIMELEPGEITPPPTEPYPEPIE